MNRDHDPCRACGRFLIDASVRRNEEGPGHCEGFDRPAHSTDAPCVLFVERGSREARALAKSSREVLAELQGRDSKPALGHRGMLASQEQRRHPETISRASASQPSPVSRGRQPERA